ncbi:MAG: hypothetical protein J6I38_11550 [Prevotella sp.]|nr:hypothetical protein [Prevotella sp.]
MEAKKRMVIAILGVISMMHVGCTQPIELPEENAVYYWRTDLRLDSTERTFLATYNIKKVYCRYFDVVINDTATGPMPNATIHFNDTLPDGIELIPTVYITENCMHQPHKGLAQKLVQRIKQMNETNDIKNVHEIQIDCDYTERSRQTYYEFLKEVRAAWLEPNNPDNTSTHILSTTIRLHQLAMEAPPADYGVLMLYNTGDPRKWTERNPILDICDVSPYLKRLDDYPLPLAAAYPVYSWLRVIQGVNVVHTVEAAEILQVKEAVERKRQGLKRSIITYHLDKENINRYKPKTYEAIYHH